MTQLFLPPHQNREQEMGDRVWQVQKELEELQGKSRGTSEVQTFPTHIHQVTRHVRAVSHSLTCWGHFSIHADVELKTCSKSITCKTEGLDWIYISHSPTAALNHFFSDSLCCSSGKRLETEGSITGSRWQPNPHAVLFPCLIIWKFRQRDSAVIFCTLPVSLFVIERFRLRAQGHFSRILRSDQSPARVLWLLSKERRILRSSAESPKNVFPWKTEIVRQQSASIPVLNYHHMRWF